jgi:cell wall-associated NlpC family hydrolase/SH3-like domain-containing protein
MLELNKQMLKYLAQQLQLDDASPNYIVRLWRVGELDSPPYSFDGTEGGVTSIDVTGSVDSGCATATITFENTYGFRTPEFSTAKISVPETEGITRTCLEKLLWPENKIQICLGYGELVIPVLTGCIDSYEIDSKGVTISIEVRDNLRFMVDQNIDPIKFGRNLQYPREDQYVTVTPAASTAQIIGTSEVNVRSGPGTNYSVIGKAQVGGQYKLLGTHGSWQNILFEGKNAYVSSNYVKVIKTEAIVDASQSINIDKTQWLASAIIQDLAVIATTIKLDGENPDMDRSVCTVITDKTAIDDPELKNYTIKSIKFPFSISYFEAATQVLNQIGDLNFRCNRYGDIMLYKNLRASLTDYPDWIIQDYVDLTSLSYKLDITDLRNRILILSKNGMAMFEHKGISRNLMKGVNRMFAIEVPWAETPEQKHVAARSFYQQMLDAFRKVTIAIKGNPLIEVGQCVKLYDLVSTATSCYQVRSWKHNFNKDGGFITTLELEFISTVLPEEVTMVTDSIPSYKKQFNFALALNGKPKPIKVKLADIIYKAMVRINDVNGNILAQIDVNEKTAQTTPKSTETIQYVYLLKNEVNIRTSAQLIDSNVKRKEKAQFRMKYLGVEGNFYKGQDTDGATIYIWKDYCSLTTSTGGPSTSLSTSGSAGTFIQLVSSKVGCPYIWGMDGQIISSGVQAFDCSGLVVWSLRSMNIIPKTADYTAAGLYEQLCVPIHKEELMAGDLIFRQANGSINHVGIYIGNGEIVEARGKNYGVIRRALPNTFNLFGRLKSLNNLSMSTYNVSVNVVNKAPVAYKVSTNYDKTTAPSIATTTAQKLGGNVLFYYNGCVLYNISVESDGNTNNVLSINWAPTSNTPVNLNLNYEVFLY